MLNVTLKPHRSNLLADTAEAQKVFVMLRLIPQQEAASTRPPLALALVIDTSGSMLEYADQRAAAEEARRRGLQGERFGTGDGTYRSVPMDLPTKLDQAIEAAHALIEDTRLADDDHVTVIHFDDKGETLLDLRPLGDRREAHQAVDSLRRFSGGTQMADGMRRAQEQLQAVPPQSAKRLILLTDGETFDEPDCRPLAERLAQSNTPIIAVGIGTEYNEELMEDIANTSRGRPYHLQEMTELRGILDAEIGATVKEVVTDLHATVAAVKGISLDSITRVYPSISEVSTSSQPYRLGNIAAEDFTVFVLELTASGIARPSGRARIAHVGLSGTIPALNRRSEFPIQELFINFTRDEAAVQEVDPEVLGYVQQKNVDRMVHQAVKQATVDAGRARHTLQVAAGMTRKVGNSAMTRMLEEAVDELEHTGTISVNTRKTVSLGGRTRTVKTGATERMEGVPSEEEIRRMTGT